MVFPMKCLARRVTAGFCVLLLVLLLTACGGSNNNGASSNTGSNTGNNTSTSSNNNGDSNARPVQQVATPTATSTSKLSLKQYTGSDFTIKYPTDWKETTSTNAIAFTDPSGKYSMTINTQSNPNAAQSTDQLATNGMETVKKDLKNEQTVNVPATTTVGGQVWAQQAISGTSTMNGKSSDVETTVLATNHPARDANTKGYSITYSAPKDEFSQTNTTYFMPMLDSFTFTS